MINPPDRTNVDFCPSADQLRALALGLECDEPWENVAQHVESCGRCLAEIERIETTDPLAQAVRASASSSETFVDEPAFREMYEQLRVLGQRYAPTVGLGAEESQAAAPSAAAQDVAAPFGRLPATFGRYLVRRQLGKGGMGTVFLAWDNQLERDVALKVPTGGRRRSRPDDFLREARAAAALDHPYICPIFDHGQIDGIQYLTLKYLDGQALADLLGAGPLPIRDAVVLCRHVAEALDAAHRAGVTHRDLKPGNIMLDASGTPFVMDFGLARREALDPALIQEGEIFGTPAYMSPEQASGQGDRVGAPSDIFSLGVVLYEMLTGRTPFTGDMVSVLKKIRREEPAPPSHYRPEIDERLDALCLKAMSKQRADRYATADEFAQALGRYLQTLPAPLPGLEDSAEDQRLARRKRWIGFVIAAVAVSMLGLLGFFSFGGNRIIAEVARDWFPKTGTAVPAPDIAEQEPPLSTELFSEPGAPLREPERSFIASKSPDHELPPPDTVPPLAQVNVAPETSLSAPLAMAPQAEPPVLLAESDLPWQSQSLSLKPAALGEPSQNMPAPTAANEHPRLARARRAEEAPSPTLSHVADAPPRPMRAFEAIPEGTTAAAVHSLAADVAEFLREAGAGEISLGSFTGAQANLAPASGLALKKLLGEALEQQGVRVKATGAKFSCRGEFTYFVDAGKVTLDARLREGAILRKTYSEDVFAYSDIAMLMGGTGKLPTVADQLSEALASSIQEPRPQVLASPLAEAAGVRARAAASENADYAMEIWRLKPDKQDIANPTEADYEPVPLEEFEGGLLLSALESGNTYAVRLVNNTQRLAAATLTIDGVNLFAFSDVPEYRKLGKVLVPPGPKGAFIKGWHRTNEESSTFQVSDVGEPLVNNPEAARVGLQAEGEIGVITAQFAVAVKPAEGETFPDDEPQFASLGMKRGPVIAANVQEQRVKIGVDREVISIRYTHGLPEN